MSDLEKPQKIASNPVKSAKWDEITAGRDFDESHIPLLSLLCHWYAVLERCIDDMDEVDGQLIYENNMDDMKPLPQLGIMKQASAEIRQLNKQLGINDEVTPSKAERRETVVHVLQTNRQSKAQNRGRTA